ncbi:N-formylglutamate amidohydrolase [Zymomonas mobilis]|uniref:N-formylglutamate amidohydrolase n=1 Tax=Zymomonas mobilis subsp. pomaceae (strain ATCC 29192 / DSM 22645 / JCM 10191 / CCUG 17912 / NBRC 13757 / NCIMB 11200 / NRRL B-4491 / Barker I) TaxID=579138 RepID=F8ETL4_ZYMMT|nr:N-formylglutamate amidohydrolase [Zymomonas mobilis]AEI37024.1 N-formylglutamate amidohydrolase [Zymomonas mobilis subsp. pomaceae ATCC 29192]MDX5948396.1 N-formylglutamate amidohydrolase [Zymomonas mobilis subsp. pomaceae]GEB89614.1 N-formylglutamate amidohydrolase [Zymomonas mobilis subsp. pomaceae]
MAYQPWQDIEGADPSILIIADHASAFIPDDINLGIEAALYDEHVALDKGIQSLGIKLCQTLDCRGIFAMQSRLIVDLNREENDILGMIPAVSDGYVIPGNTGLKAEERQQRLERFYYPYHQHIAEKIKIQRPKLIISLHSFTPCLRSNMDCYRPWHVGLLYNNDDRATQIAIPLFKKTSLKIGENEPYSGRILNATMNRHAEANNIPYLVLEIRQDTIKNEQEIENWRVLLEDIIKETIKKLA